MVNFVVSLLPSREGGKHNISNTVTGGVFMNESVLERLVNVHPGMEIWWDSSPLVFKPWVQKMVAAAPAAKKAVLE